MSVVPVVAKSAFVFNNPAVELLNTPILYGPSRTFVTNAIGKTKAVHYISLKRHASAPVTNEPGKFTASKASLAVQTIHECFAGHVPLSLSPELLWYFIVYEVATHVKLNPLQYSGLFNGNLGQKQVLTVQDNSLIYGEQNEWASTIALFRSPLEEHIGEKMVDLFLPKFTTSTEVTNIALLVTFMDTVSPYYDFEVDSWCGIPQIRLEGEVADWKKLVDQASTLSPLFPKLNGYFRGLLPILSEIARSAEGSRKNSAFWRSIYKYEDESGGPFITGWITALFAHEWIDAGPKLKKDFGWNPAYEAPTQSFNFPSHISKVPFSWNYREQVIPMAFAAGVFGTWHEWPYLSPRLGYGVFEMADVVD
jgi:hypothetical protein